jgi:hypothetical protein
MHARQEVDAHVLALKLESAAARWRQAQLAAADRLLGDPADSGFENGRQPRQRMRD